MTWTLVIHGGAGRITPKVVGGKEQAIREALARALDAGTAILANGGAAIDAVQAAIEVLEDDPHFNAGRGAALSYDGVAELDAAIMDGATRDAGAVAGTTRARHPIALARAVMERSPHVMLAGEGADAFAEANGVETIDNGWFATPERISQLAELRAAGGDAFDVDMKYGTVGAVALDTAGHLAAATSTGGVTGKRWGRIGDSPLIGAGTWAQDGACAVSCTGAGEFFVRVGVGHAIAARIRHLGEPLEGAVAAVLGEVTALGGTGGIIAVGADGTPQWRFSTPGMHRARATSDGLCEVELFAEPA
ncbi:beta-aspartyl-peptidase (threonine type) [Sphingomonas jinjuensis]|uniref:Isoaspartyl peptidase n=1 Tax=Sphingomonas jinjuensis TaxID=535907 RepID=A0A840FB92_9SPHN|nr:isoaspartyl peptidase/L-asparaginase [Sphingomonas jinjuensis]MBB4154929.1 beta-aspartyl-peptidase (threonine type) [Sphingomonas jinjuensis]